MKRTYTLLGITSVITVVCSFFFGAAQLSLSEMWATLWAPSQHPLTYSILIDIRLPRILAGVVCGIALALSGVILQSLFGNPIVDAAFIGVSGWASCGAAASLILLPTTNTWLGPTLGAGIASVLVLIFLSKSKYYGLRFTLFGFALGALANATLAVLATTQQTTNGRSLTSWLFGSLALSTWSHVWVMTAGLAIGFALLIGQARNLDIISLGGTPATHLGVDLKKLRLRLLTATVFLVCPSVALFGIIGFIGLAVPHLARLFGFTRHHLLLPASALIGVIVMSLSDLLSRLGPSGVEIPLSLTLALCGAPVLIVTLRRLRNV